MSCLFEDDEQMCALAGEVYMKEITSEKVAEIEAELSKVAEAISNEWKKRSVQTEIEKAASDLLGKEVFEHDLEEELFTVLEETSGQDIEDNASIRSTRAKEQMMKKLECFINLLPQYQ